MPSFLFLINYVQVVNYVELEVLWNHQKNNCHIDKEVPILQEKGLVKLYSWETWYSWHYQKFGKYKQKHRKNFYVSRLWWILPTDFSITISLRKNQMKHSVSLYQRNCSGKRRNKKSQKSTMTCNFYQQFYRHN